MGRAGAVQAAFTDIFNSDYHSSVSVPEPSRSALLDFLGKPRSLDDLIHKFGISPNRAKYHLRSTLRSGQVLKSIEPIPRLPTLGGDDDFSGPSAYLHITVRSPHLKELPLSSHKVHGAKFIPSPLTASGKKAVTDKVWFVPLAKLNSKHLLTTPPRPRASKDLFPQSSSQKPTHRGGKPPTHLVMGDLLQELSKQGLNLREINRRFGISKQSIQRLVRNGVLREEWGMNGIGVQYQLSKKCKEQFAAIRETSRIKSSRKESFLRLRSRLPG